MQKGSASRKESWLRFIPSRFKEKEHLPDISGEVKIIDSRTEEKETQPPRRYSASIINRT